MRSERQIMDTILSVVKSSDNIRAAYMNGSRTNPNVEKDELRDYDIVFSVNDVRRMINGRKWLKPFGDIAIMQEPDSVDMAWGENADLNKSYTFLMLFRDHVRIDLHIERTDVTKAVYGSDSLTVPLYDKDVPRPVRVRMSDERFRWHCSFSPRYFRSLKEQKPLSSVQR